MMLAALAAPRCSSQARARRRGLGVEASRHLPPANLEEARQHAAKAKVHYDLASFDKAAEEYISGLPPASVAGVLFNIAQSYRQGGAVRKAKQFYKAYLRENPDRRAAPR